MHAVKARCQARNRAARGAEAAAGATAAAAGRAPSAAEQAAAMAAQQAAAEEKAREEREFARLRCGFDLASVCRSLFDAGSFLGAGGFGEVRRVEWKGKEYALKRCAPSDEGTWGDLFEECPWVQVPLASCVGARTRNVDGYTSGDEDDSSAIYELYFLLPLATGDLRHVHIGLHATAHGHAPANSAMLRASPLSGVQQTSILPTAVVDLMRSIAAESLVALRCMHARGMVHADIKPDNILVMPDGHVRLTDLGCADEASADFAGSGTPGYRAPEQGGFKAPCRLAAAACAFVCDLARKALRCPAPDSRPVDVWALGVSLLQLLTPADACDSALASIQHAARCRSWQAPAWVPSELAALLARMLVRNPRQRATVAELMRDPLFAGVDWAAVEARRVPLPADLVALAAEGRQWQQEHLARCCA
jgi:serine/threonine protein kinase